jgi:hypothetical protein
MRLAVEKMGLISWPKEHRRDRSISLRGLHSHPVPAGVGVDAAVGPKSGLNEIEGIEVKHGGLVSQLKQIGTYEVKQY